MKLLAYKENVISIWMGDDIVFIGDTVLEEDYFVGFKKALEAGLVDQIVKSPFIKGVKSREEAIGVAFAMHLMTTEYCLKVWNILQRHPGSLYAIHPLIEKLMVRILDGRQFTAHPDIPMSHATRKAIDSITFEERTQHNNPFVWSYEWPPMRQGKPLVD